MPRAAAYFTSILLISNPGSVISLLEKHVEKILLATNFNTKSASLCVLLQSHHQVRLSLYVGQNNVSVVPFPFRGNKIS